MSQVKEQVRNVLDRLPDDTTLEEVQHQLYIIQLLQSRVEKAERGDVIPHEEVKRRVEEWISGSIGQATPPKS
jgi:hypothetical protein